MNPVAYTDGSAWEGSGGLGVVVLGVEPARVVRIAGYLPGPGVTNQVAELTAAVVALDFFINMEERPKMITIVSDSAYLTNCFRQRWYRSWQARGWRKKGSGKEVANRPIWETLIAQSELFGGISWTHMRGHDRGDETPTMRKWNRMSDNLAHEARVQKRSWVRLGGERIPMTKEVVLCNRT